ncbi:DUF421 domain-containing protein [Halobacillus sp. Marseille-P3879]|uniref:DUF421 domain-containing protein n=1 Tax=Halobacillus sp. Marseille-P3879 TaxID=2045014 RepID=UPI000C7C053D|nr:DUF421 domain-containing protein [Halobacillus sp. Marseille-P3879]
MEWDWIWKSILIIFIGTFILRIAGRKSISQMTLAQTVIMIAIGSLLIQPVAGKNIWVTFGVGALLVLSLIVMEFTQLKLNLFEKLFTGQSISIIENGQLNKGNLKKLRFTVDQLEMKLRQQNVSTMADVKSATLEPNGQIGYELKEDSKPATKKDLQRLEQEIISLKEALGSNKALPSTFPSNEENIFDEVAKKAHQNAPPKELE